MDCVYLVPIPQGTTMNVSFDDFDIEDDKLCRLVTAFEHC